MITRQSLIPALFALLVACRFANAEELPLWADRTPPEDAGRETVVERGKGKQDRSIRGVTWPTVTVYLPEREKNTRTAIIICPGGGYGGLAIDKEGHDVARWLNTQGIAGIVLKYRMPKPGVTGAGTPWPVEDARRAVRLVRARAAEWRIDPKRTGIMGFSAGGHLASVAGTQFDGGKADAADEVERQSCRPDFMVLVYPVITLKAPIAHGGSRNNLLGASADTKLLEAYSSELHVSAQTPPAFLVHAKDDGVKAANSEMFAEALKKAGVAVRLELYETGGHGFGMGIHGGDVATWPQRCVEWLKAQGE